MLKIDERTKWKELPSYVSEQFSFIGASSIRMMVGGYIFIMIDFVTVIPLLVPIIPIHLYVVLPPLVLLNLWAIFILVRNPYSVQHETLIFHALIGIFGTFHYLLLAHKVAYSYMEVRDWSHYVVATLLYIFAVSWILYYRLNRFKDLSHETLMDWKKKEDRGEIKKSGVIDGGKYQAILLYVPSLGYLISRSVRENESVIFMVLTICYLGIGTFFAYLGIKFTHRLFVMKANPQFVHLQRPPKKKYIKEYLHGEKKLR